MTKAGSWRHSLGGRAKLMRRYHGLYLQSETHDILINGGAEQYYSDDRNILRYNGLEWGVSRLNTDPYQKRPNWVQGINFGRISDCAIDPDANCNANSGLGKGGNGSTSKGENGGAGKFISSPDISSQTVDARVSCWPPDNCIFHLWILDQTTTILPPKVTVNCFEN
ncbi:hypothetical protein TrVFT333_008608 [Trichoderma virens FT-333]|nr:hypothetical protein TrVFT333_008608 [Trichoderma virens FT-333]